MEVLVVVSVVDGVSLEEVVVVGESGLSVADESAVEGAVVDGSVGRAVGGGFEGAGEPGVAGADVAFGGTEGGCGAGVGGLGVVIGSSYRRSDRP